MSVTQRKERTPAWAVDVIAVALCAVAALLFGMLFVRPGIASREQMQRTGTEQAAVDAEAGRVRGDLKSARAELLASTVALTRLGLVLKPRAELNACLGELTRLAQAEGVELAQIEPAATLPASAGLVGVAVVPIRLSGQGGQAELESLLAALHARFADVAVVGLRVRAMADGRAAFVMEVRWFAGVEGSADRAGAGLGGGA